MRDPSLASRIVTGREASRLSAAEHAYVRARVRAQEQHWWCRGGAAEGLCAATGWDYHAMRGWLVAEGLLEQEDHMHGGIDLPTQIHTVRQEITSRKKRLAAGHGDASALEYGIDVLQAVLATLRRLNLVLQRGDTPHA
ncbi:MAG: hypothetical protein P1P84_02755 [Deferrisomatales bacterium]|nr:hypothetical protein [Deferrisomatales bacterium]